MHVSEIMSRHFRSIDKNAPIRKAAMQMRDMNIGMLPVEQDGEIVGTVTDRDITVRATAQGLDPDMTQVGEVMSNEIYTCIEDDDLQLAAKIMEKHQIRRLMVQNGNGKFVGMLALADLARHHETENLCVEILEEVSQPPAVH